MNESQAGDDRHRAAINHQPSIMGILKSLDKVIDDDNANVIGA